MDHPKLKAPYDLCSTLVFNNGSGSEITSGTWRLEGETLGMVMQDTPDTEDGVMVTEVPASGILIPKNTSTAIDAGEVVYWDSSGGEVNRTDTNPIVGYALEDAAAADAEVRIRLNSVAAVS